MQPSASLPEQTRPAPAWSLWTRPENKRKFNFFFFLNLFEVVAGNFISCDLLQYSLRDKKHGRARDYKLRAADSWHRLLPDALS